MNNTTDLDRSELQSFSNTVNSILLTDSGQYSPRKDESAAASNNCLSAYQQLISFNFDAKDLK